MNKIPFVDLKAQYQSIKTEIDEAIQEVISNTAFISGKYAKQFEQDFAAYSGLNEVVACANGTDSLEILLKAMDIGPGDEVIVPALTWISTAESVSSVGAKPVFVDVDEYYLIDPKLIEEKISSKTKAIIPVHFYGQPADMPKIQEIAKRHKLRLIEDCAQAHGSSIHGTQIGSFSDAASFSFYPGKNLGAFGDAGAMAGNDLDLLRTARMIANHGQEGKHNHIMEGRNSRMDGLHGAVLSVKLKHIENWTKSRIKHADYYREVLKNTPVVLPKVMNGHRHVYHLFVIQTDRRDELKEYLGQKNIDSILHYPKALPFVTCYQNEGFKPEDFPVSYKATKRILSLPMYAELTTDQMDYIARCICEFFE